MVRTLAGAIRAAVAYPVIGLITIIFGTIAIIGARLPRRWHVSDRAAISWAWLFLKIAGLRYEVEGADNIDPDRPQVIVSNHLSNLDPMAHWLALQPLHYRYMVKKEMYKIPFFNWAINAMHMVKVDRSAGAGGYEAINRQVREVFALGYSLMVYGEGTRSRTGGIRDFKKGPFILAKAVGAPILPITIHGPEHAWPPGDWRMYGGKATVVIHPLLEFTGTVEDMRVRTQQTISETYARLEAAS